MEESERRSGNPTAKVQARLIKHGESTVVVHIGAAPIEIRQARMPKTFDKLVALIAEANEDKGHDPSEILHQQ